MDKFIENILQKKYNIKLIESVAHNSIQQLLNKIDITQLSALNNQMNRHFQRIAELTREHISQNISGNLNEIFRGYDSILKNINYDIQRSIMSIHSLSNIKYNFETAALEPFYKALSLSQELNNSFLVEIANKIREYSIIIEEDSTEYVINDLKESLIDKAKNLPKNRISLNGMLNIVFFLINILFFIYTIRSGNEDARIMNQKMDTLSRQIEKLPEEIIRELSPLEGIQADKVLYVVERTCTLYSNTSTKSFVTGVIYPNDVVELIQRKHKWIYIYYFDYIDVIPKYGWAKKKYLTMVSK